MKSFCCCAIVVCSVLGPFLSSANAAGISIDAGLTPAEDRWIIRTQARYMKRKGDPTHMGREMTTYSFPTIVAYGVRPDFTLMLKQTVKHQDSEMGGNHNKTTGLADLFILSKYKVYRRNTPEYIFGIAATLGLELPTGAETFTSNTWDLVPGLYTSWRSGPWAWDMGISYAWNGFADRGRNSINPGDEFSLDWAIAYQFSLGDDARTSIAPVLEVSYKNISPDRRYGHDVSNTGESVLYISPGVKFTKSSFILEGLLQLPVWQDQKGTLLERGFGVIVGVRFMF